MEKMLLETLHLSLEAQLLIGYCMMITAYLFTCSAFLKREDGLKERLQTWAILLIGFVIAFIGIIITERLI